jgi:hypothetical protein
MNKGIFKEIVRDLNKFDKKDRWNLDGFRYVQGETAYGFKWEAEGDWEVDHKSQFLEQKGALAEVVDGCVEIHKLGVIRNVRRYRSEYDCYDYNDYDYQYSEFEACEIREVEIPAYVELQWVEMRGNLKI